jgi:Uma2 family endonuclease
MATPTTHNPLGPIVPPPIPPLRDGDRLTRAEFERRYDAMPDLKKAELIEGVVHMPSPVRFDQHGGQHADLITWLGEYRVQTPGVRVAVNSTVRLDLESEPQPDGVLFVESASGGQCRIDADGYITDAPDWVGEVSASTVRLDLNAKFLVYARNGVKEYLVWRVLDRVIDWFVLRQGRFEKMRENSSGILQSEAFPGLWLDAAALLKGDLVRVHEVLHQGLASPEHADFVNRLAATAARNPGE